MARHTRHTRHNPPLAQHLAADLVGHAELHGLEAIQHVQSQQGNSLADSLDALEASASAAPTEPLQRMLVRDMGKIVPLHVDRIEHLRSDTKYTAIVTGGKTYLVRLPITPAMESLNVAAAAAVALYEVIRGA
jgi:two-component system LytT family response regulator